MDPTIATHPIPDPEVGHSRPELLNGTSSGHTKSERITLNKVPAIQPVQIESSKAGVFNLDQDLVPSGLGKGCLCKTQLAGSHSANEIVSGHLSNEVL